MIKLQITGRHFEVDAKISAYVHEKFGLLDKYVPRLAEGARGSVVLELDKSGREDNECVCDVTIEFPRARMHAKEATVNMYAAVDICEAKLKAQVMRYKDKHTPSKQRGRRLLAKLWSRDHSEPE